MKDIPKPVLIVFAVVIALFVGVLLMTDRSEEGGSDDPEAASRRGGWVGSIGSDNALDPDAVAGFSNCSATRRTIRVDESCAIRVPPAEGFFKRVKFRSFELVAVEDESVDFRITSDDIDGLELDEDIEGTITDDPDDDDERAEMTVGVPPGGITVELTCPGIGIGRTCVVAVR